VSEHAIIDHPSPNHDARAAETPIEMLVLHYTGMPNGAAALDRLCDPQAKVSAHYVIEEDGRIFRLVPEERRAWHAGVSCWRGHRDINGRSIGIELVNPGHEFGYRDFAEAQMAALIALARDILARHPIAARNVVGHADVAPARKIDPGERFDWARLARAGIGLWPDTDAARASAQDERSGTIAEAQRLLAAYGYQTPLSGASDDETMAVVTAFQRHFRQTRIDGRFDGECLGLVKILLRLCDRDAA
jgi:N-acetylmuramoyl-L-alanine amidase